MTLLKNGIDVKFVKKYEEVKAEVKVIENEHSDINFTEAKLSDDKDDMFKYVIEVNPTEYVNELEKKGKGYYECYYNALTLADSLKVESVYLPDIISRHIHKPCSMSSYIVFRAINNFKSKYIKEVIIDHHIDHLVNLDVITELVNKDKS